ncbi:glutathione S-transferase family protein [Phyllobacterium salinisoli]|uniref:Glutathione S-transferase family protein n=1 Tax=Phyllobacterium salinisoli TaxID=1899321 RepID=A0A368K600_9HYPH|nr:glutathione S-transferase family protein [Phyllobacterium salinisoli]RCS23450.1 glutathione S-transferase family protein [Phyllobacterium salinisoli]
MKLYNFPWGPYPRRLSLYLAEKGIADIERIEVEFPHQPDLWPKDFLRKLNPAHSLPVLDTGNGMLIGQSIAILEYLEERYPNPNMLGETSEERARTRELVAVFDEATSFFGLWARQGSSVNAGRHTPSAEAARVGAERFASKLRVGEAKFVGPFINGNRLTIADCVAMALIEFVDQFYGVPVPADCPKLSEWYLRLSDRETMQSLRYPQEMLDLAYGLPEQTQVFL